MLYLAPLQGLTDLPFRKAFAETFGNVIDYAVSPFISLTHGDSNSNFKKLKDVLPDANKGAIPLIPQILGNNAEHFLSISETLYDLGYREVNWNLGCPVKRVINKKRGSGLLPYPGLIDSFLETVFSKTRLDISLKIRLGYADENEIFGLIPVFNAYPIKNITIHPRIGIQMYEGELYWETFAKCVHLFKTAVVFNGDIKSINDVKHLHQSFPEIENIMIGRGLLINPLLPGLVKGVNYSTPSDKIKEFTFALLEQLKLHKAIEKAILNKMKEYWGYLAENFEEKLFVLNKIQAVPDIDSLEEVMNDCFNFYALKNI